MAPRHNDAPVTTSEVVDLTDQLLVETPADDSAPVVAQLDPIALQLLRSAVALHAEDLLRTIGALANEHHRVDDWVSVLENDVRDVALLTVSAVQHQANLPAGFDAGGGDPRDPMSIIEGLLASHEALITVLRDLASREIPESTRGVVTEILTRREQEVEVLRTMGAGKGLPPSVRLVRGALPRNWG